MSYAIYLSAPDVGPAEEAAVAQAIASGWVAPVGPSLSLLERTLEHVCQMPHAVGLSSGTAALHMALQVAGIGKDAQVLVPSFGFAATAFAVHYVGATPVFIDCDPYSYNMDPNLAESYIKANPNKIKAAILVHSYGNPTLPKPWQELASRYGFRLIEDAAEALGSRVLRKQAGGLAPLATLSFNGNKIVTTSGGGALLCQNPAEAALASKLASQAREPKPYYLHQQIGYNYRLSNVLAAMAIPQLQRLDVLVERRRSIFAHYQQQLAPLGFIGQAEEHGGFSNRWLSAFSHTDPAEMQRLKAKLDAQKAEWRPLWKPLHTQPVFADAPKLVSGTAESLFANGICLPSGKNAHLVVL